MWENKTASVEYLYWTMAALDPGVWYSIVCKGGCRCMAARARERENAPKIRQMKREAEEVNIVGLNLG